MVGHGRSDDRKDLRSTDAADPAADGDDDTGSDADDTDDTGSDTADTEDDPEAGRSELSKAPLIILGLVFGGLFAMVAAKILVSESDQLDVTSAQGESSIEVEAEGDSTEVPGAPDDAEAENGETRTGTPSGSRPISDTEAMIETIAEGFVEDFSGLVDSDEALCMARTVVDLLGIDRLWQMTEAIAQQRVDPDGPDRDDPRLLSRDEEDRLNAALRPCVSDETADKLNFG